MKLSVKKLVFLLGIVALCGALRHCVNERDEEVDWYFAIRMPLGGEERKFLIFDSKSNDFRSFSGESFLKYLFISVNQNVDKIVAWSDQKPDTTRSSSSSYAHSKGIMAIDESYKGFILSHSVPRYPRITKSMIDYVTNTKSKYGQSFICLTLKDSKADVEKIYNSLLASNVDFYENDLELKFTGKSMGIVKRMFGRPQRPLFFPTYVKLVDGFKMVTKSRDSDELPFEDTLSQHFQKGWLIETWGRPYLKSQCEGKDRDKAENIKVLRYGNFVWKTSSDHSKWGISLSGNWVCFGDLNHMSSQSKRGGSFFCKESPQLHGALKRMVAVTECDANYEEKMQELLPKKVSGWDIWRQKKEKLANQPSV